MLRARSWGRVSGAIGADAVKKFSEQTLAASK